MAMEALLINGSHVEVKSCNADDYFFCETPNFVALETAKKPTQLTISYQPNFTDILNNNNFNVYYIVYNKSVKSVKRSTKLDNAYPLVLSKTLVGLEPYTYYCFRMGFSSFQSSGFYTKPKCAWTPESVPSVAPDITEAYHINHSSIYLRWNLTYGWNGKPVSFNISWGNNNGAEVGAIQSSYVITGVQPTTVYNVTIRGTTSVGSGVPAFVQVNTGPKPLSEYPANIALFQTGISSLNVTWSGITSSQYSGVIRGYGVFLYDNADKLVRTFIACPSMREMQITDLSFYHKYGVKVRGFADTFGPYTPLVTAMTGESVPSVAPNVIEAHNTSHHTIYLRWNLTHGWNGKPVSFEIAWGTGPLTGQKASVSASNTSYYITGLQSFTVYNISIGGATGKGMGKVAFVLVKTDDGPPVGFPAQIKMFNTGRNSLNVTWSEIPEAKRNGIIRGYRLSLYDIAENKSVATYTVCASEKATTFESLKPYHLYGVVVSGITTMIGVHSPVVLARTDESVPLIAPSNLIGMNLTHDVLYVSWDLLNPQDPKIQGRILGYALYIRSIDNVPTLSNGKFYSSCNTSSKTITNLWPNVLYNISVSGFTKNGEGPRNSLLLRTDGRAPEKPPSNTIVYNLSSESLRVDWGEVNKTYQHDIVLGYKISLYELDHPLNITKRTVDSNVFSTLFNGLKVLTLYVIELLAFNKYGDGPSQMLAGRTTKSRPKQAPTLLKAWNTSSTSLAVSWQAVTEGVVTGYKLTYTRVDNTTITGEELTCNLTAELRNLDKYTLYNISVQAYNKIGLGPVSEPVLGQTDEDVPSLSPVALQGFNTSDNVITISWNPVPRNSANGLILGYYISYNKTNNTAHHARRKRRSIDMVTVKVPVEKGNYTLQGLDPYTWYSFSIAAYTAKGTGNWSPIVLIRTDQEVPQIPPTQVSGFNTSSTSINVTWVAIPSAQVKGVLTSYTVQYLPLDKYGNNVTDRQQFTVPSTQMSAELKGLKKYTNYSISVSGVTRDIGVESQSIFVRTSEDAPDLPPQNIILYRTSHSMITVTWSPIPELGINGILQGYFLSYKKTNDIAALPKIVTVPAENASHIVMNLKAATSYSFWMRGFTVPGQGVLSVRYLGSTQESVPDRPPGNFLAKNFSSDSTIHISWSPIHHDHIRGILLGYKVFYKKVRLAGDDVHHDRVISIPVPPSKLSVVIGNLDNFAVYEFQILGYTKKGDGVISAPMYGETCACTKSLSTSFYVSSPYVTFNQSTSAVSGLIPIILELMVDMCCSNCINGHGRTRIDYLHDANTNKALKTNLTEFTSYDGADTDLVFPINGFEGKVMHGENTYVKFVTSPGVALIAVSAVTKSLMVMVMFQAVLNSWTLIAFMLSMVWLVGILTWLLDRRHNPENFSPSFIKGTYNGIWMAFITITTLGYGDCVPKSVPARIITIVNALAGFILISLITANLSRDLVVTSVNTDIKSIYGAKLGAIKDSFEYQVAIRRNAKVEKDYYSFEDLRQAMIAEEVQGILVDLYVSSDNKDLFHLPDATARISKLLKYDNILGVAFGGRSSKLQGCFNNYISSEREKVFKIIQAGVRIPEVQRDSEQEISSGLIDSDSDVFKSLVKYGGGAIVLCCVIALVAKLFRSRKQTVKPGAATQRAETIKEMKRFMKYFYNRFSNIYHELRERHIKERKQFLKEHARRKKYLIKTKTLTAQLAL